MVIGSKKFVLPVGYQYEISNPALWHTTEESKGIYRPLTEVVAGTIESGENEAFATYEKAIIQPFNTKNAEIYSIDEAEQKGDGKVVFK